MSGDPIVEMNSQWNLAIGTSNADIDAFFNGGTSGALGGLNGAFGGAAAKFNQLPLNGAVIEDSATETVSSAFGRVESRGSESMNSIKGAKPVIAFPEGFSIGTAYQMPMMMMPGMQMGSRGYSYVNSVTGDYYGSSNFIVEVPSATPGILTSRLALQGTISRTNGAVTSDLRGDYFENLPGSSRSYRVQIVNPGSSSELVKFSASQTVGEITTYASLDRQGGITSYYSFGGSGSFGDITVSFSKSKMFQTERLFGTIEYLSGNVRASAQFKEVTSPNANYTAMAGILSFLDKRDETLDKYLQVGAGSVTGTVNGQSFSDSFGMIRTKMPVKRLFPWSDTYVDFSSTWHNGEYSGGVPLMNSLPSDMSLDSLFISHDNYKSGIFGQMNQFSAGYLLGY